MTQNTVNIFSLLSVVEQLFWNTSSSLWGTTSKPHQNALLTDSRVSHFTPGLSVPLRSQMLPAFLNFAHQPLMLLTFGRSRPYHRSHPYYFQTFTEPTNLFFNTYAFSFIDAILILVFAELPVQKPLKINLCATMFMFLSRIVFKISYSPNTFRHQL